MKHIWSVLCEFPIVGKEGNNISLINVIEELRFPAPPKEFEGKKMLVFGGLQLALVSLWVRSKPQTEKYRVALMSPTGKQLEVQDIDVEITSVIKRYRTVLKRTHFPFSGWGTYQHVVSMKLGNKWKKMASVPLDLLEQKKPT